MPQTLYVGLDVLKYSISVALAEEGRDGDVRFLGDFKNTPAAIAKFCRTLSRKAENLELCYEAGCFGYGIYRQLRRRVTIVWLLHRPVFPEPLGIG